MNLGAVIDAIGAIADVVMGGGDCGQFACGSAEGFLPESQGLNAARTVRIVEQDRDVVHVVGENAAGKVERIANMSREGETVTFSNAHVDGPGPGTMGVKEIKAFARQLGEQLGAKVVRIEGAVRTTGANKGSVPKPITIYVKH